MKLGSIILLIVVVMTAGCASSKITPDDIMMEVKMLPSIARWNKTKIEFPMTISVINASEKNVMLNTNFIDINILGKVNEDKDVQPLHTEPLRYTTGQWEKYVLLRGIPKKACKWNSGPGIVWNYEYSFELDEEELKNLSSDEIEVNVCLDIYVGNENQTIDKKYRLNLYNDSCSNAVRNTAPTVNDKKTP